MKKLIYLIIAAALLITGCDKTNTRSDGPGRLSVQITDDPFDINFVESATVTITKIEVRKAGDDTENPFLVVSETPVIVDLIDLRNGITLELANIEVPNGDYDLVRLYVDEASLKIKDQPDPYRLKVPSGSQTGIKLFVNPVIHVEGGLTAELLLDFDLSKSFVMRGNMSHSAGVNGFIFKPSIRAANISTAGRIVGLVQDNSSVPIPDAKVSIEQGDFTATAYTDETGHYTLVAIPAGTYSVTASQTGFESVTADGIVVIAANRVVHDFILVKLLTYVSSVIENATPTQLVMTYNQTLANVVPDASAFAVTVNTVARSVTAVAIDGAKVVLTLASAVVKGDVVTVAYTKPATNPLQSADNTQQAESLTAQPVTNNVGL